MSRKRLSIYLMAGPDTPQLAAAAVAGGADLLEVGFPFSDPLADGPAIRRAAERALAQGMRTKACLACLADTRALVDVPLIPMTYASLLEAYGWERFVDDARAAGATSFIVADLPVGERPDLRRIELVAPTSTDERIGLAASHTDGWLYLVTVTGTTGAPASSRPSSPASSSAHGGSPTCRCSPGSGSRLRSTPPPRQPSPTASWSARARSRWPRTGPTLSGPTSRRSGSHSTRSRQRERAGRPPGRCTCPPWRARRGRRGTRPSEARTRR